MQQIFTMIISNIILVCPFKSLEPVSLRNPLNIGHSSVNKKHLSLCAYCGTPNLLFRYSIKRNPTPTGCQPDRLQFLLLQIRPP